MREATTQHLGNGTCSTDEKEHLSVCLCVSYGGISLGGDIVIPKHTGRRYILVIRLTEDTASLLLPPASRLSSAPAIGNLVCDQKKWLSVDNSI